MIVNGNIIREMLADTVQEYIKETRNPHHAGIFCGMQASAKLGSQSPGIGLGVCLGWSPRWGFLCKCFTRGALGRRL